MRISLDAAGRLVIPKEPRERLGLRRGRPVEIRERDGRIEIEPAALARSPRVPAHVLLETDSVLTRLPPPHRAPARLVTLFRAIPTYERIGVDYELVV